MTNGMVQDQQNLEKQMGCMTGFLHLFDRHHILTGKRNYTPKRLPPTKVVDASPNVSDVSASSSPAISGELGKPKLVPCPSPEQSNDESPKPELPSQQLVSPCQSNLPLQIFELKDGTKSSWKFRKEAPRLSLDSRATVDAKGSLHPREIQTNASLLTPKRSDGPRDGDDTHRKSPSVIARLMGLGPLPDSDPNPEPVEKNAELRRSASESRVSRDIFQGRLINNNNFQSKQPNQLHLSTSRNLNTDNEKQCSFSSVRSTMEARNFYYMRNVDEKLKQPEALNRGLGSQWKPQQHRKSYFDSVDVFPEPKQTMSIHGDLEKRLRLRGIDEHSKDLETLKQILEALQLKGLLHSSRPSELRNFVYDKSFSSDQSPIVVVGPSTRSPINHRTFGSNESSPSRLGVRRNPNITGEKLPSVSPRRERPGIDRNVRSPMRSRSSGGSPTRSDYHGRRASNSVIKPNALSVETERREATESSRRISPVHSPKVRSRRIGSPPDLTVTNRSSRHRKSTVDVYQKKITAVVTEEESSSSISESSMSTPSQTDTERLKMEEYKEGKSLLERCDKVLHSIAEMNAAEMQPSPVSVLDSSLFYKEDSSASPSPVMKRSINFKDQSSEYEDELWSYVDTPFPSKVEDESEDYDFVYISEILRASHCLPQDSDVFLLLEKHQYLKAKDVTKVARLQRKLIFDVITEILERNRKLPPWKPTSRIDYVGSDSSVQKIWSEFQRIRERDTSDDLFEVICGVLKKDLAGDAINGWADFSLELSEAVLDLERLIFKDLIGETIRDLAAFACKSRVSVAPRRKLVF